MSFENNFIFHFDCIDTKKSPVFFQTGDFFLIIMKSPVGKKINFSLKVVEIQ